MANTAEQLLTLLEGMVKSSQTLAANITQPIEQQHVEHREFVKALERMQEQMIAQTAQMTAQTAHLAQLSANDRVLGEMLVKISETLSRTEQMTARVLAEIAAKGPTH
jgi:predicted protein tyrosine phosphatase